MPTTVFLYPHAVSRFLDLRLLDPYDPSQEDLDLSRWFVRAEEKDGMQLTIDLSREDIPPWRALRVGVEANLPASELVAILPPTSNPKDDTLLVVSVQCAATKFRQVIALAPQGEGRWKGGLLLQRADVRDAVRLRPRLVRRTKIPAPGDGSGVRFAHHRGAVIAEGRDLAIVIDESRKPLGGTLKMQWEDFRQGTNPWRKDHPADVFHLEPYGSEPILWLNSRYEKLRAALYSRTTYGADAAVRHLGNALLAQTVWTQLFIASLCGATKDEALGSVELPTETWKRGVLAKFLPRLYPELPEGDRLERALDDLRTPEQSGTLMSLLGTAAQEILPTYRLVEKAIVAAERSKGDDA